MHHRELAHAVADQATSRIALGLIGRSCTLFFTSANGKDFGQPGLQKIVDISRVSSMLVTSSAAESDK
jgi:hypothetical protein